MTALANLLPCPFCGSTNVDTEVVAPHTHKVATFMPDYKGGAMATCYTCCAAHWRDGENAKAEVIAAWNRRATLSPAELGGVAAGYVSPSSLDALDKCRKDDHNGTVDLWMRSTEFATIPLYTTPRADEAVSELRIVAKRNLRSLIERGSDDKALMLKCLEELS